MQNFGGQTRCLLGDVQVANCVGHVVSDTKLNKVLNTTNP